MPASNVTLRAPLLRFKTLFPGQFGVPGSDVPLGIRTNPTGNIYYVDPNHADANDDADGTDPEQPLETITEALTRCANFAGDVIAVSANNDWPFGNPAVGRTTAIEEAVIVNKHGVSIIGLAPSSPIGVIWKPPTAAGVACTIRALDVLIEGFAFCESDDGAGGGTGIYCEWNATTAWGDSSHIRHCYFGDGLDYGIQLEYAWNTFIEDSEFVECVEAGIYSDPADDAPASLVIQRNRFLDCGIGQSGAIIVAETVDSLIQGNWIYNGTAQSGAGVALEGIDTHSGGDNIVSGNYLSCALADFGTFCNSAATDAYIQNFCLNGPTVTNP